MSKDYSTSMLRSSYLIYNEKFKEKSTFFSQRSYPNKLARILSKCVKLENKIIIDIGCGVGQDLAFFIQHNPKLAIGLEPSANGCMSTTKLVSSLKDALNVQVWKNDIQCALNLGHNNFFDVVYAHSVFHLFGKKLFAQYLKKLRVAMTSRGVLALALKTPPRRGVCQQLEDGICRKFYNSEDLQKMLKEEGFTILYCKKELVPYDSKDVQTEFIHIVCQKLKRK